MAHFGFRAASSLISGGEGGGVRVCRYFFFCPRLQPWTKLMENLAPSPSQNHGWENGTSWLRRGFILDFGGTWGLLFILLCLRLCRYVNEKGKNSLLTPRGLSAIKEEAI